MCEVCWTGCVCVCLPASVLGEGHGVPLMQVEVGGQLPQVRLGLYWLVDLEKQVDGILSVSIWWSKMDTIMKQKHI